MKWRSINNKPAGTESVQVLLARFEGNILMSIYRAWWYADGDGDGFFAPSHGTGYTHWMPYDDYWELMQKTERT